MSSDKKADLVIVANRLPVDRVTNPDGSTEWRASPGGLVTALEPVMRSNDGAWIGWSGGTDEGGEPFDENGMTLVPVPLSAQEIRPADRPRLTAPVGPGPAAGACEVPATPM